MAEQKEDKKVKAVPKPEFEHCWIDGKTNLLRIECGGVTFAMRNMTAGEEIKHYEYAEKPGGELDLNDIKGTIQKSYDGFKLSVATMFYSLGGETKLGDEGWSDTEKPVTWDNVLTIPLTILQYLAGEHAKFFRLIEADTSESSQDD